jgi:folate-binding protein YgfZ
VPSDGLAVDAWWGGDDAVDLVGASVADVDGIDSCSAEAFDAMRVATGWPAAGVDFAAGCIPAETGLVGVAVSFSKGCYPGQELVERMDSRAVTAPHTLRLVDDANFHVGDVIVEGVTVTSVGGGKAIVRAKRDVAEIGVALGPV